MKRFVSLQQQHYHSDPKLVVHTTTNNQGQNQLDQKDHLLLFSLHLALPIER
jgi:hypothetical protein